MQTVFAQFILQESLFENIKKQQLVKQKQLQNVAMLRQQQVEKNIAGGGMHVTDSSFKEACNTTMRRSNVSNQVKHVHQ